MRSFKAALANEVFKMTRKKKPVLILILSVVSIATVLLIILALRGGLGIMGSTAASFPITVLSIVANTILPLFTALAIIDAFTGEFAADTMKICIAKPVTRLKIYLAKLTSVGLLILASLLAVMILSMAVSLLVLRLTPDLSRGRKEPCTGCQGPFKMIVLESGTGYGCQNGISNKGQGQHDSRRNDQQ